MDSKEIINITNRYGAHNYEPLDVVLKTGKGVFVWDMEGKRYMDCLSSYSALNHGHCHPDVVEAAKKQLDSLTLTSRAFHNDQLGPFLQELCTFADMDMALPMNTGAEAVETALKAARKWAYETKGVPKHEAEIIVAANNFHGRTITIITFSTEEMYRDPFGPFTPGFKVIPYNDPQALQEAITPNTAAFMVEPIQGEGGVLVPDEGYLAECRRITRENNVLLMMDEVQTGFGRCGKAFAWQYEDAKPDLLIVGKALGGGVYPVSGVIGTKEVLGLFRPGEHGSTFGGNPLAAAVGRAALKVLKEEKLAERSFELGKYMQDALMTVKSDYIKEVRGKGLLIGVELTPDAGGARRFCEALQENGLLAKETHENVIRFAPPLIITREQVDWAVATFKEVMSELA